MIARRANVRFGKDGEKGVVIAKATGARRAAPTLRAIELVGIVAVIDEWQLPANRPDIRDLTGPRTAELMLIARAELDAVRCGKSIHIPLIKNVCPACRLVALE